MRMKTLSVLAAAALVVAALASMGDVSASTLSIQAQLMVRGTYTSTVGLTEVSAPITYTRSVSFTNGVAAGQADLLYTETTILTDTQTVDRDLAGGGLTDAFGAAFEPATVRLIAVCAASANTTNVVVGGDANSVPFLSAAATTLTLKPGACFEIADPSLAAIAVTAGTGDILQFANSGAANATYELLVLGTSS